MDDQEKQANTVSKVVILVGCAFAALFVAIVVVMAVRESPARAGESDYSVTYTMSPTASTVDFVPNAGAEFLRIGYGKAFQEAPVSTSYRLTVAPAATSYTFEGAPRGASYRLSSPVVYYHMSTGEKTVTGVHPEEKKK